MQYQVSSSKYQANGQPRGVQPLATCYLLLATAFGAGCAGPVINPAFKENPSRVRTVRILPPEFEVAEVGVDPIDLVVGGYQATRASDKGKVLADESAEAVRYVQDEAAGELEERGFRVLRPLSHRERDADKKLQVWCRDLQENLRSMDRAYLRSGREAFPPDRGVGPVPGIPGERPGADAVLALYGRGQVESRDQRILGSLLTGTNKNVIEMTSILVDARSGDLLWRSESSSPGADATRDWQIRAAVRETLAGFPDSNP